MKKIDLILAFGFLILIVVAFAVAGKTVRSIWEMDEVLQQSDEMVLGEKASTEKALEEEAGEITDYSVNQEKMETEEEHLWRVRQEAEANDYPEEIIELLEKNPETVDFVENYGLMKNQISLNEEPEDIEPGEIPLYLQWDECWGYINFGTSIIGVSGCGPTCMAMVAAGLNNDSSITPDVTAAYEVENNYVDGNNNTYWSFMREAGIQWGLSCEEGKLSEAQARTELLAGHPIICSMGPGDFTDQGHFIVLTGFDNGQVTVNDPFSRKNSEMLWEYTNIYEQCKAMWVYWKE